MKLYPYQEAVIEMLKQPEKRKGSWMQTFSGRQFWPLDPRAEEVCIEDIAHALSMQCRYAGHCLSFYSVAEHSVLLALKVASQYRIAAIVHDSPEAYLQDLIRPVKPYFVGYEWYERAIHNAICKRFKLSPEIPRAVKDADNRILHDELAQNMAIPPAPWNVPGGKLGVTLQFWTPKQAKFAYLTVFNAALEGDEEVFSLNPWFLAGPIRLRLGRTLHRLRNTVKVEVERIA